VQDGMDGFIWLFLWIVEGAQHQDLLAYDRQGYEKHVVGFLSATLAPSLLAPGKLPEDVAKASP
jgi:hypothetical protein